MTRSKLLHAAGGTVKKSVHYEKQYGGSREY